VADARITECGCGCSLDPVIQLHLELIRIWALSFQPQTATVPLALGHRTGPRLLDDSARRSDGSSSVACIRLVTPNLRMPALLLTPLSASLLVCRVTPGVKLGRLQDWPRAIAWLGASNSLGKQHRLYRSFLAEMRNIRCKKRVVYQTLDGQSSVRGLLAVQENVWSTTMHPRGISSAPSFLRMQAVPQS
jgi:hypothetical protein